MKVVLAIVVASLALTGCVVAEPYYFEPAPVVRGQPRPIYVAPIVRCDYVSQWNSFTNQYQNVRVCK